MASATITNLKLRNSGDQKKVTATVVANNTNTWIVPHISNIEDYSITCTTAAAYGATVSGNTMTFAAGSELTFQVSIYGR